MLDKRMTELMKKFDAQYLAFKKIMNAIEDAEKNHEIEHELNEILSNLNISKAQEHGRPD
jgi:translation initiation factor 2 alpha subunit (eIF-2alpha)